MTDSTQSSRARTVMIAVFAAILATGLLVRLDGITRESVWWDEFTSLIHLDPPDAWKASLHYERWKQEVTHEDVPNVWTFWQRNRKDDPATMPLYYTFEYFWNRYVSQSIVSLRLLSIAFGMLLIPLVYLLGRDLFGRRAGLIAALCVALSPVHRQFAQEIRMYVVMTVLATASAYTFVQVVRNGRGRWWALHAAANLLLLWTHPFAVLLPFAEGVFLMTVHGRAWRRLLLWAGIHALLLIPSAIYISTIQFWPAEKTAGWQKSPGAVEVIGDLLADDAVGPAYRSGQLGATPQLRGGGAAWERFVSVERAQRIAAFAPGAAKAMMLMFLAFVLGLGVWVCGRGRRTCGHEGDWRWFVFMVLWWLLPAVTLYVVSLVWRPCSMPRYTLHSSIALYCIIGGAIASIRWRWGRAACVCGIVALFGYEQTLVLGGSQHTDWRAAANFIRASAKADDPILIEDDADGINNRLFAYNFGPSQNIVSATTSLDVLAEQSAFWVDLTVPSKFDSGPPRQAWAVIATEYFGTGPCRDFESALGSRGLSFTLSTFGGMQQVMVYQVRREHAAAVPVRKAGALAKTAAKEFGDLSQEYWRLQDFDLAVAAAARAVAIDPKYSRGFTYLGMALKEKGDRDGALAAFRKAVAIDPRDYLWSHVNIADLLIQKGEYDGAIASVHRALEIDPKYGFAYTTIGRACLGKRDYDAAISAFEKAIAFDPQDPRGHDGLKAAQAQKSGAPPALSDEEPPAPAAGSETGGLIEQGKARLASGEYDAALAAFQKELAGDRNNAECYGLIGLALLGKGDESGALASLRKSLRLSPEADRQFGALVRALFETRDYEQAWTEVKRIRSGGVEIPRELMRKLEQESGRTQ